MIVNKKQEMKMMNLNGSMVFPSGSFNPMGSTR